MANAFFQKADGYFERNADPDLNAIAPQCYESDGAHYCPAAVSYCSQIGGMVVFSMAAGRAGLFISFTPEGIRILANDLLGVADKVEAEHAQTANAQLAATLAKKAQ